MDFCGFSEGFYLGGDREQTRKVDYGIDNEDNAGQTGKLVGNDELAGDTEDADEEADDWPDERAEF